MQTSFDFTEFRLYFNVSDAPEAVSDLRAVQINRNIGCLVVMIQPFFFSSPALAYLHFFLCRWMFRLHKYAQDVFHFRWHAALVFRFASHSLPHFQVNGN